MSRGGTYVAVSTTVDSEIKAQELARGIVEHRLAACVQFFPVRSMYRWKGVMDSSAEFLLVAKTRRVLTARLMDFVRKHHTYEVPEIIVTPIAGGLKGYLAWMTSETRSG